jgi:hypothetical protein
VRGALAARSGDRHASHGPKVYTRGQVPQGHLVSSPHFVSPWDKRPSGEWWYGGSGLGPRAPRQRYAISVYVIHRYTSIYISVNSVAALRELAC